MRNSKQTLKNNVLAYVVVLLCGVPLAHAELSTEELAKLAQNPVGKLISVPFQNNSNLNFGPEKKTQNVLNIQPVIPISINNDWTLITRTVLPVISMPALVPDGSRINGTGDMVISAFLSPATPGHWIWGAGPVVQLPTNSNADLGNKNWGLGPSAVLAHMSNDDPWVYGFLVNNIWSVADSHQGGSYNNGTLQFFVNYNFSGGTYFTSSPIITADWNADNRQRWTVPLGGGFGKIFHIGKQPVNASLAAYYNVVSPDYGPNWQIRAQVQFMFPE